MATSRSTLLRSSRLTVVAAAASAAMLVGMDTASALGARFVSRSCGINYINSSGASATTSESNGASWPVNNACTDSLGVAGLYNSSGGSAMTPRRNSPSGSIAIQVGLPAGVSTFTGGYHWGCPTTCTASTT